MALNKLHLEIFGIYFLPVVLIIVGVLPFEYRFLYLVVICCATIVFAAVKKYSLETLGLSFSNFAKGIQCNFYLSILFLVFFLGCSYFGLLGREYIPENIGFYLFYIFISCPLQEFTYRSYFFRLLDDLKVLNPLYRIALNSVVFCFLHAIYKDVLTLLFTLIIGLIWATLFQRTKSVYGVCLSHIVFGTISIAAGLV